MKLEPLQPGRRVLCGIAAVCFSNLLLEVVLTRIFSATMFYHFTFLAIALALFGVGASGVYVYIKSERFTSDRAEDDLARHARRFAGTTVLAVVYVLANPIDLGIGTDSVNPLTPHTFLQLLLLDGFAALPFFFAGMVVSLAILHFRQHIGRVYFFDLAGASLAALTAGVLLGLLGGPSVVLAIAVLALAGSAMFRTPRGAGWLPLAGAASLLALNLAWPIIGVASVKGVKTERTVLEKWNIFSRITVERLDKGALDIKIDASASTRVTRTPEPGSTRWQSEGSALAYALFEGSPARVLIIGPGGGPDVANALAAGAAQVTGVEINPIIARDIMLGRFEEASGSLYRQPRVRIVVDEGRSFIRRSDERFDVIQATLVDTWAATASGAFALTENMLYTREAFADYYRHLTERGVLTMSRWYRGRDPETARLLVLAAAGLVEIGVDPARTRRHIFLAHQGSLATLVAKRTPLTDEEVAQLHRACKRGGLEAVVSPDRSGDSFLEKLVAAGPYSEVVSRDKQDLSPPSDDRPFFFYFIKAAGLFGQLGKKADLISPATWILFACGAAVVSLALLFILMPLIVHRRDVLAGGGRPAMVRRMTALAYFALIGLGFITLEIALMQKVGFFLGHPSYGLVVVLFAILLATGIGARLSARVPDRRRSMGALAGGAGVALLALLYAGTLDPMLHAWVAWPLGARIALAVALVGAAGMTMGLLLPLGVRLVADTDPEIIPWGWGVNGATSVIGTVMATVFAIHLGFNATLLIGAALYLAAAATAYLLGLLARRPSPAPVV